MYLGGGQFGFIWIVSLHTMSGTGLEVPGGGWFSFEPKLNNTILRGFDTMGINLFYNSDHE